MTLLESLAQRFSPAEPLDLLDALSETGFDVENYASSHIDLKAAGLDTRTGAAHFLLQGIAERRDVVVGRIGNGIGRLQKIAIHDQRLWRRTVLGLLRYQVDNSRTTDGIPDDTTEICDLVRACDGHPFVVIGDSHSQLYIRNIDQMIRFCLQYTYYAAADRRWACQTRDRDQTMARGSSNKPRRSPPNKPPFF